MFTLNDNFERPKPWHDFIREGESRESSPNCAAKISDFFISYNAGRANRSCYQFFFESGDLREIAKVVST